MWFEFFNFYSDGIAFFYKKLNDIIYHTFFSLIANHVNNIKNKIFQHQLSQNVDQTLLTTTYLSFFFIPFLSLFILPPFPSFLPPSIFFLSLIFLSLFILPPLIHFLFSLFLYFHRICILGKGWGKYGYIRENGTIGESESSSVQVL